MTFHTFPFKEKAITVGYKMCIERHFITAKIQRSADLSKPSQVSPLSHRYGCLAEFSIVPEPL